MIIPQSNIPKTRNVVLPQPEKDRINDFLQGAVYCWCKNREQEWFSLRDLMGGDNYDWTHTPLSALYNKQVNEGAADPVKEAGKECGRLLIEVIINDARNFETKIEELIRKYHWINSNVP
jgi:hypothetical protein